MFRIKLIGIEKSEKTRWSDSPVEPNMLLRTAKIAHHVVELIRTFLCRTIQWIHTSKYWCHLGTLAASIVRVPCAVHQVPLWWRYPRFFYNDINRQFLILMIIMDLVIKTVISFSSEILDGLSFSSAVTFFSARIFCKLIIKQFFVIEIVTIYTQSM